MPALSADIKLKTVVIDPGHGGHDPGCVSKDKKTFEKNLALDIGRKLAAKITSSYPDVEVVMTRSKDVYVTLNDRAGIANRNNADLFISIHINSVASTSPNGCSVHVLGQSSKKDRDLFAFNMDVCKRENSVILMEEDYTTKYQGFDPTDYESYIFMQLMQNSHLEQSLKFAQLCSDKLKQSPIKASKGLWQDPYYVLWKTAMPAVLIELGFISNSSDLTILRQESSRAKIADQLFSAFKEYKKQYDGSVTLTSASNTGPGDASSNSKAAVSNEKPKTAPTADGNKSSAGTKSANTGAPSSKETTSSPNADSFNTSRQTFPKQSDVRYGVQVFSLKNKIPENDARLLGYKPVIIEKRGLHKYIIAVSDDIESVRNKLPEIRKTHPESFIVTLP